MLPRRVHEDFDRLGATCAVAPAHVRPVILASFGIAAVGLVLATEGVHASLFAESSHWADGEGEGAAFEVCGDGRVGWDRAAGLIDEWGVGEPAFLLGCWVVSRCGIRVGVGRRVHVHHVSCRAILCSSIFIPGWREVQKLGAMAHARVRGRL